LSQPYYTLAQLKQLALDSATRYRSEYNSTDADTSYNYAATRSGYENPASTDTDYHLKQYWLLELMKLWFYYDIHDRYLLKFDVADLKLSQTIKNIKTAINMVEDAFKEAKGAEKTAYLFVDAEEMFANTVVNNNLTDDAVGQDYREEEDS